MPNNRQIAILGWLLILAFWAVRRTEIRASLLAVFRSMRQRPVLVVLLMFLAWVAIEHFVLSYFTIWNWNLATDSAFWIFGAGLPLLIGFSRISEPDFFTKQIISLITVTALLEFIVSENSLHVVAEIVLFPILALLTLVSVVPGQGNERAGRVAKGLLAIAGASLVLYSIVVTCQSWTPLEGLKLSRSFASPALLSIGIIPLVFGLSLYGGYELLFLRMRIMTEDRRLSWRSRLGIFLVLNLRLGPLHCFSGQFLCRAGEASTFRETVAVGFEFLHDRREKKFAAIALQDRVKRYTGVAGVDEFEATLDQRELRQTRAALRHLASCHVGWRRQRGCFRKDLLELLCDFKSQGLEMPHGITMCVPADGKYWYAYRRTPCGRFLGIGACAAPTHEWLYDSDCPPSAPPAKEDAGWHSPFDKLPPNWEEREVRARQASGWRTHWYPALLFRLIDSVGDFQRRLTRGTAS